MKQHTPSAKAQKHRENAPARAQWKSRGRCEEQQRCIRIVRMMCGRDLAHAIITKIIDRKVEPHGRR